MKEYNKIYLVGIDTDKSLDVAKKLMSIDESFIVANSFTTNHDYADIDLSDKFGYYISEEQLNLDFRNNSLLYVLTDGELQESVGIAIDEFYNSNIIPLSIRAFNTVKRKHLENALIVWIDTPMNRKDYSRIDYQVNMIESKYFLKNIDNHTDSLLYFAPNDDVEYISNVVNEFYFGDDEKRAQILEENS